MTVGTDVQIPTIAPPSSELLENTTQDSIKQRRHQFEFCGDQQNSCEKYKQPVCLPISTTPIHQRPISLLWDQANKQQFICCPVKLACFAAEFSPSGIVCCGDDDPCEVTEERPATCVEFTTPCSKDQGGGCCPEGTECSTQGCVDVYLAAPGLQSSLPSSTGTSLSILTAPTMSIPSLDITSAPTQISTSLTTKPPGVTTVTATRFPDSVTVTTIKLGEVAQSQYIRSARPGFGFSSWPLTETCALGLALVVAWTMALIRT